jgi:hypothetical protein
MVSLQVRRTQPALPVVGYVLAFSMLRSLDRVNMMTDLMKQDSPEGY